MERLWPKALKIAVDSAGQFLRIANRQNFWKGTNTTVTFVSSEMESQTFEDKETPRYEAWNHTVLYKLAGHKTKGGMQKPIRNHQ